MIRPNGQLSAAELNATSEYGRQSRSAFVGGMNTIQGPGGDVNVPDVKGLHIVRITSVAGTLCGFQEQYDPTGTATFEDDFQGLTADGTLVALAASGLSVGQLVVVRLNPYHPERYQLVTAIGATGSGGQGGIGNGLIPPLCKVTDAYGVVTYKMPKILLDNSLVCLPIPDCCPSRFYCVDNRLLVTAVGACCAATTPTANRFTATRILRVEFRAKTGYAADVECGLPDGIFLVSDDGLTWTPGSSVLMRATTFTGGLTVSCVAGVLKATWGMSGFTGGTPTSPFACLLTGTAVSLGTFNVALNQCTPCDPTIPASASTVEVWISSVLNAASEPESPLTVLAGYIPPYATTGGPFKTIDEAIRCCNSVLQFQLSGCATDAFRTWKYLYLRIKNATGIFINAESRVKVDAGGGYTQSVNGTLPSFPTTIGSTYGFYVFSVDCFWFGDSIRYFTCMGGNFGGFAGLDLTQYDYIAPSPRYSPTVCGITNPFTSVVGRFPLPNPVIFGDDLPLKAVSFKAVRTSDSVTVGTGEFWIERA